VQATGLQLTLEVCEGLSMYLLPLLQSVFSGNGYEVARTVLFKVQLRLPASDCCVYFKWAVATATVNIKTSTVLSHSRYNTEKM